jgi:alpha-beta hydrolase superfamily lysophospholipase
MLLLSAVAGGLALWALRWHSIRVAEQLSSQRLPVGPDGIIPGAEGFSLQGSSGAVLLVHGFGDTPQTLRELGAVLHADGWTVLAPLLPGVATRTRALLTGRRGAPVYQLYSDLAKLWRKGVV